MIYGKFVSPFWNLISNHLPVLVLRCNSKHPTHTKKKSSPGNDTGWCPPVKKPSYGPFFLNPISSSYIPGSYHKPEFIQSLLFGERELDCKPHPAESAPALNLSLRVRIDVSRFELWWHLAGRGNRNWCVYHGTWSEIWYYWVIYPILWDMILLWVIST